MNLIYDFETLGPAENGAVVSLAMLKFDENLYEDKPYNYDDLLSRVEYAKFNVVEQVEKFDRIIDKKTLEWWQRKSPEAQAQLKPSKDDISIEDMYEFFTDCIGPDTLKKAYTRGNGFDPIVLESVLKYFKKEVPYPWWIIRDTRSMLDGMCWGSSLDNKFIPKEYEDKFVHHDPRHDIVMDVMRMQTVARYIYS